MNNQKQLLRIQKFSQNSCRSYSIVVRLLRILVAIVILTFGGMIYILYRDQSLNMFEWIRSIGLLERVVSFRTIYQTSDICGWFKYSLPDGLWLFSYMYIIDAIWNGDNGVSYYVFVLFLPIIALSSEFLQLLGWVPGVFDWFDVSSYLLAICIFFILKLLN